MKTIVIESNKGNGKLSNKTGNKDEKTKAGALPVSKAFDKAMEKTEPIKMEAPAAATLPEPTVTPEAAAAPGKAELREQLKEVKPALNLESTLKLVEELHRRKIQRDKLLATLKTLDEFEIAQKDDAEETDSNHFQGCDLTITDDSRRDFSTRNPYIIQKVAEYIKLLCMDKLAEIEGEIHLPA